MRRYSTVAWAAVALAVCLGTLGNPAPAEAGKLRFHWATAKPSKFFLGGGGTINFGFKLKGTGTRNLRIDIIRLGSERVRIIHLRGVPAGRRYIQRWNGRNVRGKPVKRGTYLFKVKNVHGKRISLRGIPGKRTMGYFPYKFPVRGRHYYGDGIGAPRRGHRHQGQDIFAACGTRMVAPRGGRVQYKGFQGAAGHYLVLDMWHTRMDAAFMHLRGPSPLRTGDKIKTGRLIGYVGQSGNASGCHLHFELWSGPGWYEGGHFLNPTRKLRKWDSWS
jgi:murein DD-endopeptidase MepM/ murein hydrolase activator NlpD